MSGIEIADDSMLREAEAALASGELTPDDAALLSAAVESYSNGSSSAAPTQAGYGEEGGPVEPRYGPAAETTPYGPPEAPEKSTARITSDAEAEGLEDAIDQGHLDGAPPGILDSIAANLTSWWDGGTEAEAPPELTSEEPRKRPAVVFEEDDSPRFDAEGRPVERFKPEARPTVDSWRGSLSKDERFYAPPANFAGNALTTKTFYEPNVGQVEELLKDPALAKAVGYDGGELRDDSDAYKKTADLVYRKEYLKAKEQGTGLFRYSQFKDDMPLWAKGIGWFGENVITPAAQGALAFDRGATAGLVTNLLGKVMGQGDELNALRNSASNFVGIPGEIAGAISPGGIGSKIAGQALRLPGMGALAGSKLLSARTLGGALGGGMTAAGEGGAQDLVDLGFGNTEGMSPKAFAERRMNDALMGGAMGAGGQVLGELGGAGYDALRRKYKGLHVANEVGADVAMGAPGGVKSTPKMRARELAYEADPVRTRDPMRQGFDEIAEPLENAARDRVARQQDFIGRQNQEFYDSSTGQAMVAPTPLWEKAIELVRRPYDAQGKRVAFQEVIPIQEDLARMTKGSLTLGPSPGSTTITQREARKLFGDRFVENARANYFRMAADGSVRAPERGALRKALVKIAPKKLNAEQLDKHIKGIQDKAKVWKKDTGGDSVVDKMYDELHVAALKSRENVSPAWAKQKQKQSQAIEDLGRQFEEAGLPARMGREKKGELGHRAIPVNEMKKFENTVLGVYDTAGKHHVASRALEDLAADAGKVEALAEIAAMREIQQIRDASSGVSAGVGMSGGHARTYAYAPQLWNFLRKQGASTMRDMNKGPSRGQSLSGTVKKLAGAEDIQDLVSRWRGGRDLGSPTPAMGLLGGLGGRGAPTLTEDQQDAKALFIAMDMAKAIKEWKAEQKKLGEKGK